MSITTNGIEHRSLVLTAGNDNIEVLTSQSDPTVFGIEKYAFADFVLCDVVADRHISMIRTELGDDHYVGMIPYDVPSYDYPARLSDLSFTILKDAGQRGHSSLWLNFSDRPMWRRISQTAEDYTGFLEGIRRYAELVRDEQPTSHISRIFIRCGISTHAAVEKAFGTPRFLTQMRAIFPAGMLRAFR